MADGRQGPLGWTWMGCATVVLTVFPLWFGLSSTFVYLWGKEWWTRMDVPGPVTLFGIELVWWVSGVQAVVLLALIAILIVLFWVVVRLVSWIAAQRARGDAERYASLAGDTTMRADAWADTSNLPEPDEEPTEEGG